ncbi:MAG: alpha/beta fold hydrolase [Candidatus Nomurabacteria bacterium]|nr:alpha/beta fold hydrolase [Candidatus Nomurabacteria bacterium]
MRYFKYLIIILILFSTHTTYAISINYGNINGWNSKDIFIQYYGVNTKTNYLCSLADFSCDQKNNISLGKPGSIAIPSKTTKILSKIKADYITLSPSKNILAYYLGTLNKTNGTRTFVFENIKNKKTYTISKQLSYWDSITDARKLFDFIPNSNQVVYVDDKSGSMQLYIVEASGNQTNNPRIKELKSNTLNINNFIVTDSNTIYYIANTKADPYKWSLYKYNISKQAEIKIDSGIAAHTGPLYKIGKYIAFYNLEQKGYGPAMYDTKSGIVKKFNIPGIQKTANLDNEHEIKIGDLNGIIMTPSDMSVPHPLLVWLHGGPYRQAGLGYHSFHSYGIYDEILQKLSGSGVIVLKLDYRGSLGFGTEYSERLKGEVGRGDVNDVINSIDNIKSRYNVNDVYMAGNSYGGYLSLKTLAEHPEKFRSIMSINGVTDWESLLIKMKTSIFNVQFGGLPDTNNRSQYDQASIINKIRNIGNQKIFLVQGQSDRTIPPWQADLLYGKLKDAGKNVTFIPYAGEDHVFKYKKNIDDLCIQMFNLVNVNSNGACTE